MVETLLDLLRITFGFLLEASAAIVGGVFALLGVWMTRRQNIKQERDRAEFEEARRNKETLTSLVVAMMDVFARFAEAPLEDFPKLRSETNVILLRLDLYDTHGDLYNGAVETYELVRQIAAQLVVHRKRPNGIKAEDKQKFEEVDAKYRKSYNAFVDLARKRIGIKPPEALNEAKTTSMARAKTSK